MNSKLRQLAKKLEDDRSGKVIFVSHCLMNENARYLGGAFTEGCVDEVLDEIRKHGIGVVQMKCPEQAAWGGVLKKHLWLGLGLRSRSMTLYRLRGMLLRAFLWHTKRAYRKMARGVAAEIEDYRNSGLGVVGVVGVDGSPSCGVGTIVDMKRSFDYLASFGVDEIDRNKMNELAVMECLAEGSGLFIEALKNRLARRSLRVDFYAYDLAAEITGRGTMFEIHEQSAKGE